VPKNLRLVFLVFSGHGSVVARNPKILSRTSRLVERVDEKRLTRKPMFCNGIY
jgi:hypothetical protein